MGQQADYDLLNEPAEASSVGVGDNGMGLVNGPCASLLQLTKAEALECITRCQHVKPFLARLSVQMCECARTSAFRCVSVYVC